MATIDTTRPAAGFSTSTIVSFIARVFSTIAAWNDARITRKSLSKLSDRELDDIGLSAADIDMIATRSSR
ncbi:DUF1127 domain-containing protein [Yoonia sp.]|uniref:DUF1127 domain-containing protein n=1 Tax=Yoonia sp. TaxID=2212373 RepID=UPI003F6A68F3